MAFDIYRSLEKYYWIVHNDGQRLGSHLTNTAFNIAEYKKISTGTQKPTIIIPGFGKGNSSTYFLRKVLELNDHNPVKWRLNKNLGFNDEVVEDTIDHIKELTDQYGETVNIVGQSVGGCYARMVANNIPDHINVIVTLGTPINSIEEINPESLQDYNDIVGLENGAIIHHGEYSYSFGPNPPVPTTSIYSKEDGLIPWEYSIIDETHLSENIETDSTHYAMGLHLHTVNIIADRLIQHKEHWDKYH